MCAGKELSIQSFIVIDLSQHMKNIHDRCAQEDKSGSSGRKFSLQSHSDYQDVEDEETGKSPPLGKAKTANQQSPLLGRLLAAKENQQVWIGKASFVFVLMASAIALGYTTHWYLSQQQDEDFRKEVRITYVPQ